MEELDRLLQNAGDEPWAKAWRMARQARGEVGVHNRTSGLFAAHGQWNPTLRPTDEIRERVLMMAHLSRAIEDLLEGDGEGFEGAMSRYTDLQLPFDRLEHPELHVVFAISQHQPPPEAARAQVGWRGVAAGALMWLLGIYDDLDEAFDAHGEISHGLDRSPPDRPFHRENTRPLAEVRAALDGARARLQVAAGREHHVLVEAVKALRWATEPWWPELALTPWRTGDQFSPKTLEGWRQEAIVARTQLLAESGADARLRPPNEVADTALSMLLQGSYLAHALRLGEPPDFVLQLASQAQIRPTDPGLTELLAVAEMGGASHLEPSDLMPRVWLSAGADALFWALGMLSDLSDDDPPEDAYVPLIPLIQAGNWPQISAGAGLRSHADLFREQTRWQQLTTNAEPGSRPYSFAAERARALRWILEPKWRHPLSTPWDGSDQVRPFNHAPL